MSREESLKLHYLGSRVLLLGGTCDLAIQVREELLTQGFFVESTYYSQKERIEGFKYLDLSKEKTLKDLGCESFDYVIDFLHTDYESLVVGASDEDMEKYYQTNLINRIKILKSLSRKMILKRQGRFLYISSCALDIPEEGQGFYVSSKAAIEAIYRQMDLELKKKGISCLNLRYSYLNSGRGKNFKNKLPLEEVAKQIVFFLSREASLISGTYISIHGGDPLYKYKEN